MTFFAFRGVKNHEWIFYDPIKGSSLTMKYLDEFRDPSIAKALIGRIRSSASRLSRSVKIMEICGSHTVSIFRSGIKSVLPPNVTMISGPGCPVCVTAMEDMDRMISLACGEERDSHIIATFGDMIRVPGTVTSLEREMASGADVRVTTSPLDSLLWAEENPEKEIVFLGVGFETTSPTVAAVVKRAKTAGLANFSVYPAFKLLPPALEALLDGGDVAIDGFLCPGHVSIMLGAAAYRPFSSKYQKPCVVAGFEPLDILLGISMILDQLLNDKHEVGNAYSRAVSEDGNQNAMSLLLEVFQPCDAPWRGLGVIPSSGLGFNDAFMAFDAVERFGLAAVPTGSDPPECACGEVLRGVTSPPECPLFGLGCTPDMPIGSCMVSSEGSCAAWFKYSGGG